ncbi:MAG: prepilin-type N-terminal cleavage/methylation domain-containing protein [Sedimentisphaerales bacterium]
MKKGFTITELLVAVGLLAVVLAACGIIFNYSIDSHRTAGATAEIMRNLRVITDQLNADFAGLRKDAPLVIEFSTQNRVSADSVVFFSTGDFQTSSDNTVRGNVARIYYGQSGSIGGTPAPLSDNDADRRNKILARKQVILAPDANTSVTGYECEARSLIQEVKEYIVSPDSVSGGSATGGWLGRPNIDPNTGNGISMYLAKAVDNFSIMFCGSGLDVTDTNDSINWWPLQPNAKEYFGFYPYYGRLFPEAIKFTFTLYDSKGIIKTGRRFEHIVYIGR